MACDYHLLSHPGIQTLSPYIPGKSAEELAKEQGLTNIIKLASNENPFGCSPMVIEGLHSLTGHNMATYTTSADHPFRKKLADSLNIDLDQLIIGNGSDALIPLLQTCFALHTHKHVLTHEFAFISYSIFAKILGIPVVTTPVRPTWDVDIDALIAACNENTGLIFIANPNNPTGCLISQDEIYRLLNNIPERVIVVLDEAYYEFIDSDQKPNTIVELKNYPNLIVMRTFSKAYGLAGLRLGYAISSTMINAILLRALPPFTVNEAALVAGKAALDDKDFVEKTVANNNQGLQQLEQGFTQLNIPFIPSSGNFMMFDCEMDGLKVYQGLLQHGIIVRPLHAYGINHFLRVSVGTPPQNHRFLESLKSVRQHLAKET